MRFNKPGLPLAHILSYDAIYLRESGVIQFVEAVFINVKSDEQGSIFCSSQLKAYDAVSIF